MKVENETVHFMYVGGGIALSRALESRAPGKAAAMAAAGTFPSASPTFCLGASDSSASDGAEFDEADPGFITLFTRRCQRPLETVDSFLDIFFSAGDGLETEFDLS